MPATATLSTTTLSGAVGASDGQITVASTSGMTPGTRLFIEGELMSVVSLGVSSTVNVKRGRDGTAGRAHDSGTIYIGRGDQFYTQDPVGSPPEAIAVSPWINVTNGSVWFARGSVFPAGEANRWWQKQETTRGAGPLGVETTTLDPTAST